MNKSKYEWADFTMNPIRLYRQGKRKRYSRYQGLMQLNPQQKPKKIFLNSRWDWNTDRVKEEWLDQIVFMTTWCSQHYFQILSKEPIGYKNFRFPSNVWLGTSISTTSDCHRVEDLCQSNKDNVKFLSIDPIHEQIDFRFLKVDIDWIILGAETDQREKTLKPKEEWINSVIENAREEGIALFIKGNIGWPEKIQEFPV